MSDPSASKEDPPETCPPRRLVFLGASNVARAISTVFETARGMCGCPVEILAAIGRGRSYGIDSSVLGRRLPGILHCGLWQALAERPALPTSAVVTDIGNDILYGVPPVQIAQWVEKCLERLLAYDVRIVMTLLPISNVEKLTPARFRVARALLFPRNRQSLEEIREKVFELNDRIRGVGEQCGVTLIEQQSDWYGFDPIHVHRRNWAKVWQKIFSGWPEVQSCDAPTRSLRRWLYLTMLKPEQRVIWGVHQHGKQPAARFSDNTTISLY